MVYLFRRICNRILNVVYSCCFAAMDSEELGEESDWEEVLQDFKQQRLKARIAVRKEDLAPIYEVIDEEC